MVILELLFGLAVLDAAYEEAVRTVLISEAGVTEDTPVIVDIYFSMRA